MTPHTCLIIAAILISPHLTPSQALVGCTVFLAITFTTW
jgi:hypothetical protein